MNFGRVLLAGSMLAGLAVAGAGVASAVMDTPQDAVPAQDPVGDLLRDTSRAPLQNPPPAQPATPPTPGQPEGAPAPIVVNVPEIAAVQEEVPEEVETAEAAPSPPVEPVAPGPRQRRPVALVQAVDKITAETMIFEVGVGGRPVRFNNALIVSARACEVSGPGEQTEDSIAYLDISLQPRGGQAETRQIFRGWMFASSPSVSGIQHPVYDAWVVGCKA